MQMNVYLKRSAITLFAIYQLALGGFMYRQLGINSAIFSVFGVLFNNEQVLFQMVQSLKHDL